MSTLPALNAQPLSELGAQVFHNLSPARLIERILLRGEAQLASSGAVVAQTGAYTGRTPQSRFIARDRVSENAVAWGAVNQPIDPARVENVRRRVFAYLRDREIYVQDCFAGGDPAYGLRVRVITELAWHGLFARQLFLRPTPADLEAFVPDWTVIAAPGCEADPAVDGTPAGAFIFLDFERHLVLIGGTHYAGEIKKSIFSVLNFLLPSRGVMPMHCSANVGASGDCAIFFGLSGTGKTTLSADPDRQLIGDDEHGWSDNGVFNFEGGCYAKCIHLSRQREPHIWDAIRFGTVLENVVLDPDTREPDFDSDRMTENTRAAYPLEFCHARSGIRAPHPRTLVLLTADAFGVMPPVARLTHAQALYHFLSGYTAKLGGTEAGVREPRATFSACFGEPFLPLSPATYASMLGERLQRHGVHCWLINTGWTGGGYGQGERIALPHTRAMVAAALDGTLEDVPVQPDPYFQVQVPAHVPGVPDAVLRPRTAWADPSAYDSAATALVEAFQKNFQRFAEIPAEVAAAGPARR